MIPFRYLRPSSLEEARDILARDGKAKLLGGGTDLLVQIRAEKCTPSCLIDLKGISGLSFIRSLPGKVVIGALTPISEICSSEVVRLRLPMLAQACGQLGGVQTRNKATLGGNLCNASPSAETACPLLVLEASVTISGKDRERTLSLLDFFIGPGMTALGPLEILKEITIPLPEGRIGTCYQKLGRRSAMEIAITNVAVSVQREGDRCLDPRIALGAVAPVPMRALAAESILKNAVWDLRRVDEAADSAARVCKPISDVRASDWYRREMVKVLVQRALRSAWEKAKI